MSFDLRTLGEQLVGGTGLFGAFASTVGYPTEVLNLTKEKLAYVPQSVLTQVDSMTRDFKAKTEEVIKTTHNDMLRAIGVEQYVTPEGLVSLRKDLSLIDLDFELPQELNSLVELMESSPQDLFQNLTNDVDKIQEAKTLISQIQQSIDITATNDFKTLAQNATSFVNTEFAKQTKKLEKAVALNNKIAEIQSLVNSEILERIENPLKEPVINSKYSDSFTAGLFAIQQPAEDVIDTIRTVFGPPRSSEGQFLLSLDGLYFNSQEEGGLTKVLTQVTDKLDLLDKAKRWDFNFSPNLGGKGEQLSSRSFNKWMNSMFDLNIIDDSKQLADHYKKDGLLQTLIGQHDKRLTDLTKIINSAEKNPQQFSQAVVDNMKLGLVSESSAYLDKVNRRKKQIEIAAKAPTIFKTLPLFEPGTVPVNDFSYLQKFNLSLALEDQKKLVINSDDVAGIVLPIEPKFVVSSPKNPGQTIDHLTIPDMGMDSIVVDGLEATDASAAELPMEEYIASDGLFALYNFLNSDVVLPSSLEFNLNNCMTPDDENNAQLVCKTAEEIFFDLGLAAPHFNGITRNSDVAPTALGSFAKLPDTIEFQNWTYQKDGFSFETWAHIPTLDSRFGWKDQVDWKENGVSSLYRLILGNENTGIKRGSSREDEFFVTPLSNGSEFTKGMIFGFTIDKRWTRKELPSNDFEDQKPEANGYGLILAPTVSYDSSSVAFISSKFCDSSEGWLGMYVGHTKQTASGKTLENCVLEYTQISLSVDYINNKISIFLDGELLETSSVTSVFGNERSQPIRIPTFKQDNSFDYREETVGPLAPKSIKNGPKLYPYFTPWILGGGYTDGNYFGGGFMGGEYGGLISGLRGYLGSVKFYKKAINQSDIEKNFNIQSKLFKQLSKHKPKSVILALGQSNMDGEFTKIYTSNPGAEVNYVVDESYLGALKNTYIWTPSAVDASAGSWQLMDIVNPFDDPDRIVTIPGTPPTNINFSYTARFGSLSAYPNTLSGYGGLNATRYDQGAPAFRFIDYELSSTNFGQILVVDSVKRHFDLVIPFAEKVIEYEKQEVYIIKNAKNGLAMVSGLNVDNSILSFTDNRHPGANVQGSGVYYTLKNDVSAAIDSLNSMFPDGDYDIKAILLLQGEFETLYTSATQLNYPDLENGQMADKWGYYFSSIFYPNIQSDLKQMLGDPDKLDIPIILGRTHIEMKKPIPPGGILPINNGQAFFVDNVRAQQEAIAANRDLNVHLVNLDGIGNYYTDNSKIHFTAEGIHRVGLRFFDKYKEIMEQY